MSKRKLHSQYGNWYVFEVRDRETVRGVLVHPRATEREIALAHQENQDWLASRHAAREAAKIKLDAFPKELEPLYVSIPDFI